jgi:glycosyltransferase 2 family protein
VQAALSRRTLERAAHVVGAALCVLALVLLVRRGIALGDSLGDELRRIPPAAFALSLAIYVVAGLLLALGWAMLVRLASAAPLRRAPLFVGHLRAQLAKYLPGNVFHYAWRHLSARREGAGHRALALALGLESVLIVASAAILALGVVSDPRIDALAPWARHLAWAAPFLAITAWVGIGVIGRRGGHERLAPARTAGPLSAVFVLDLVFFVLAALSLRLLCEQPGALPLPAWCGWFALAWALGYATPGAPAGLGLREAVLALGLAPVLGEAQALALALACRLVTVAADAVLALAGFALLRGTPARGSAQVPR